MGEYNFGECKICRRFGSLKNGICALCKLGDLKVDVPSFFGDLFGNKTNDDG